MQRCPDGRENELERRHRRRDVLRAERCKECVNFKDKKSEDLRDVSNP